MSSELVILNEEQVKELLDWEIVYEAVDQALRSIPQTRVGDDQPTSVQKARVYTPVPNNTGKILKIIIDIALIFIQKQANFCRCRATLETTVYRSPVEQTRSLIRLDANW